MQVAGAIPRRRPRLGRALIHAVLSCVSLACALPLLLILSASFTEENALVNDGFRLVPSRFSLDAYRYLLSDPAQIGNAYLISTLVTLVGSLVSLLLMALLGYALSRRDFPLRKPLAA